MHSRSAFASSPGATASPTRLSQPLLITELSLLFGAVPLLVSRWVPPWFLLPSLWIIAGAAWLARRQRTGPEFSGIGDACSAAATNLRDALRAMGLRFAVCTLIVAVGVSLAMPERFLVFPRERPGIWLAVMALYPILSVCPQEFLYRKFFFARYAPLFPSAAGLTLASAIAFGWVHLIFRNPYAIGLTLIGGWFFADTYRRTRSLGLACLEHALYGCMVFTLGLGDYFFHGVIPTTR